MFQLGLKYAGVKHKGDKLLYLFLVWSPKSYAQSTDEQLSLAQ